MTKAQTELWKSMIAQSFHPRQWFDGEDEYLIWMEEESIMWVYRRDGTSGMWLVGFYSPDGEWNRDSHHEQKDAAAARVHWLNGGNN